MCPSVFKITVISTVLHKIKKIVNVPQDTANGFENERMSESERKGLKSSYIAPYRDAFKFEERRGILCA